jgi:hypothetical protein
MENIEMINQAARKPGAHRKLTMKTIYSSLLLSLWLALASGVTLDARADDKPESPANPANPGQPSKPESKKSAPQQLSGKVVAVDKYGKTITLQVNNVSYVLQIADATRISLAGKERSIRDVIIGEQINVTVLLRELTDARVEIAVLAVELGVGEEAQGKKRGRKSKETESPFHKAPTSPDRNAPATPPRP